MKYFASVQNVRTNKYKILNYEDEKYFVLYLFSSNYICSQFICEVNNLYFPEKQLIILLIVLFPHNLTLSEKLVKV